MWKGIDTICDPLYQDPACDSTVADFETEIASLESQKVTETTTLDTEITNVLTALLLDAGKAEIFTTVDEPTKA